MLIKKQYLTLTLNGTLYNVSTSKTKTPLSMYVIPRDGIRFRQLSNADTIQINPIVLEEIKTIARARLSDASTDQTQPLPIYWIENTHFFLLPHTSNALLYIGTNDKLPNYNGKYYSAKFFLAHKIYELTNSKPADHVMAKFRYNNADIYLKLSQQTRSVPIDQYYGLIQSGGDGISEWEISDLIDCIIDDTNDIVKLPLILTGKYSCSANITSNLNVIKSMGYHQHSWVNTLQYSEDGTKPKMLVRGSSTTGNMSEYGSFALMHRNGFMVYRHQMTLEHYTFPPLETMDFGTVDVTLYTTSSQEQRIFIPSSFSFIGNQLSNDLCQNRIKIGTFYMLNRAIFYKGASVLTVLEDKRLTYPFRVECMTIGYAYTKAPCLISGGVYSNKNPVRIKMRYGSIFHNGNPTNAFYHNGSILDGDIANLPENASSSKNACIGRIIDLKIPDLSQPTYFYDQYSVIINFLTIGLIVDTEYGVVYEDNTEETITIAKENQGGNCVQGWFQIEGGTHLKAIGKPGILEAENGHITTNSETLNGFPVGNTLFPNASNKKIAYVFCKLGNTGSNGSSNVRNMLIGLCLSPKTP